MAPNPEDDSWTFEPIQIVNFPDGDLGKYLLALGQDAEGEVYVLTSSSTGPGGNTGKVYQLRSATE